MSFFVDPLYERGGGGNLSSSQWGEEEDEAGLGYSAFDEAAVRDVASRFYDTPEEVEAWVDLQRQAYWTEVAQAQMAAAAAAAPTQNFFGSQEFQGGGGGGGGGGEPFEEEFLEGGFLPPLPPSLPLPPASEQPLEIEQFQDTSSPPPLGMTAAVPDSVTQAAAQAAAQAALAAGWVPSLWSPPASTIAPLPPSSPPRRPPRQPFSSSSSASSSASSSSSSAAVTEAALRVAEAFAAAQPPSLAPPQQPRRRTAQILTARARVDAIMAAASGAGGKGGSAAAGTQAAAVWTPPRVEPLPLTFGTGWQVDFGKVPSRLPTGNRPAPTSRAKFQSYQPVADLAPSFASMLSFEQAGSPASSSFLNYTARGNVRPEQHKLESCAYNGSSGVVSSNVTTSYTPYTHAHEVDQNDLGILPQFAETDPDNHSAPKAMTLHLLPSPTDGHTHTVELTLSQAKTIASGRPLTTSSSEPNDPQVASHVHMVTIGC